MTVPILLDQPESFETERLLIRAPRPGDGSELNAAVLESLAVLKEWLPWAQTPPSVADSEATARQGYADFLIRKDFPLRLFLKGTTTLVGCGSLHPRDWDVPRFEIGYWCRQRFVGQGYITEAAVRGITHFGFTTLQAQRMEIRCNGRNTRSARVAERAGYHLEATLHHDRRGLDGQLDDTRIYALLRDEFGPA